MNKLDITLNEETGLWRGTVRRSSDGAILTASPDFGKREMVVKFAKENFAHLVDVNNLENEEPQE